MRSTVATEVPPNFITRRGMGLGRIARGRGGGRTAPSGRYSAHREGRTSRRLRALRHRRSFVRGYGPPGSKPSRSTAVVPEWLEIPIGILAGLAVVAGLLVLAIVPDLRPRRRKSWLANPNGAMDEAPIIFRIPETRD